MRLERGADMVRERRGSGWREVRKKREKDKGTSEEKARDEKRAELGIPKDSLVVGHVGRTSPPQKNHP